jgi:hypothetical protein
MADESRPVSPFVLQKIRERKAAAQEEPEEVEEPEDKEENEGEDEIEEEHDHIESPKASALERPEARDRSHRARGTSGSLTDRAGKFFKKLGPTQTWLLIGGGLLVANHLMVPRGTSVLSRMLNAVAPSAAPKARPRFAAPVYYYAGANQQAGWNRGVSPYGPWGHASPGGSSPYAHARSWGW